MSLRSDLILALYPENKVSIDACCSEENARRSQSMYEKKVLTIKFSCPPKNLKQGFACGSLEESCDLIFSDGAAKAIHFYITYNPSSGLLLVVNNSRKGTTANQSKLRAKGQSIVIEHQMKIRFGSYKFTVLVPTRNDALEEFLQNQSYYLGSMINQITPTAVLSKHTTPGHVMNRVGRYLEVTQLGVGGFGEVVLLCTKTTGELFAAKRFGAELTSLAEMKEEAATLRKLSHVCCENFIFTSIRSNSSMAIAKHRKIHRNNRGKEIHYPSYGIPPRWLADGSVAINADWQCRSPRAMLGCVEIHPLSRHHTSRHQVR